MTAETIGADSVLEGEIVPVGTGPAAGVPRPTGPDAVTAAVLAALDQAAEEHLADHRPHKTRTGYARDWALWTEYLDWLAPRAGHRLPDTAVTTGTLVGFVIWLDAEKAAAMSSIDRRITGVTVTCRREHKVEVPKAATTAAREKLKQLRNDPELGAARRARGRGQAPATTPDQLRAMNTAPRLVPRTPGSRRRRREYEQPELARLRDRSLSTLSFAIAGRASHVSALDTLGITLESRGLRVVVPPVKGEEERTVVVGYGEHEDSCPVRCWLAWKQASGITDGPAFREVDQWGHLGTARLTPDSCGRIITRLSERARLDVRHTGHSQRVGLITAGTKAGKPEYKLRQQSGHADGSPVFHQYVRDAQAWDDAATEGIGL